MSLYKLVLSGVALTVLAGCTSVAKSPTGFRLPDGDADKGRALFVELRCHTCHYVDVRDLPAPPMEINPPVVLGGPTLRERTDGELVSAIINPSHSIAPGYPRDLVMAAGKSRMKDYNDTLTVRQLTDLVAFLHSTYTAVPPV